MSSATPGATRHKYETLDALRGVAAIAVVLFHLQQPFPSLRLAPHGYLAVDLFFALSGFVIAHAYDAPLARPGGLPRFVLARAIRLYPIYLLGVALALWAAWRDPGLPGWAVAAGGLAWLAFLPLPLGRGLLFPYNGPSWSLSFELAINLVFALVHPWLGKRVIAAAAGVGAVVMAAAAVHAGDLNLGHTLSPLHLAGGAARALFAFSAGVLLKRTRASWPTPPALPPVLLLAATALVLCIPTPAALTPAYDLAFALIGSPLLVALAVRAEPPRRMAKAFRWLADISYPVYALHWPVRDLAVVAAARLSLDGEVAAALALAALLLLCQPLARLYDEPVRQRLSRRLLGPGATAPRPLEPATESA